jgi:thiaminase
MSAFTDRLHNSGKMIWDKLLSHPFLEMTYTSRISDEVFGQWIRQDYIFVREAIPFIAQLITKAPLELRSNLANIISMLVKELSLFEGMAADHGISLDNLRPSPTCHAYLQYLYAIGATRPIEESFTVLYAAEKAYYDSWKTVKDNLTAASKWQTFIDYWSSNDFAAYVRWIAGELDKLAEGLPENRLAAMVEEYLTTGRYEYMFWTMAQTFEAWPI